MCGCCPWVYFSQTQKRHLINLENDTNKKSNPTISSPSLSFHSDETLQRGSTATRQHSNAAAQKPLTTFSLVSHCHNDAARRSTTQHDAARHHTTPHDTTRHHTTPRQTKQRKQTNKKKINSATLSHAKFRIRFRIHRDISILHGSVTELHSADTNPDELYRTRYP